MNSFNSEQTYYDILEIELNANHHEVVAAYNRAKEAYAPDSQALYTMFTQEEARELRNLIEEAFRILGNQTKRKEYDQILLSRNNNVTELELPDFAPTAPISAISPSQKNITQNISNEKSASISIVPSHSNSSQTSIPSGFAKSRLSIYEIKPEMEAELQNQEIFDGLFLRKIRLYKNINIDQLSKETRISRSYLMALETDDFGSLPAPVFLRGFVIQVARMLGLDENKVANSYMSRVKKDS